MLAIYLPSGGRRMVATNGFRPLLGTLITWCPGFDIYTGWDSFQKSFYFRPRWSNFGSVVAEEIRNWWFPTIIWNTGRGIHFIHGAYAG